MKTFNLIHALGLGLALFTVGCGDDSNGDAADASSTGGETGETAETADTADTADTEDTAADSTGGDAMAEIRVLHLGVNAPGVDVFANGEGPVVDNLMFRAGTEYLMVPAGDYTFQISVAGTSADEAVLEPALTLDADTKYTAVAIGDLNEAGDIALQVLPLVDDDANIDAAEVRITVIHAAPAVGEVDVWEISDPENPAELLSDVPFGGSATLPDIPAGALEIGLDIDNDMVPDVTFSVPDAGLGGLQVNVYANNDANGGVALVAQLPDGTVLPIDANPAE